jgi:hypothetical protein
LPEGVRALTVADRAREAMLSFLSGVGWGKREVAAWLAVPYAQVVAFAGPSELEDSDTFRRPAKRVGPAHLEEVLRAAKEEALAALIMAAPPDSDVRFTNRAILAGHVVRTRDASGRGGWAPVDSPRMLLLDRILSLVTVDYLMRPADYLALLSVCGECQAVSFDAQMRVRGRCTKHRKSIGKMPTTRR